MIRSKARSILPATVLAVILGVLASAAGCGGGEGEPVTPSGPPSPTDPGLSPEPAPATTSPAAEADVGPATVYLLGGSSARECIVSNADWSGQLSDLADSEVRAIDLGATNQSYTADRRLVRNMDDGPTVVVIGVSLGRYTAPPPKGLADKKLTTQLEKSLAGEVEVEHRYSEKRIYSDERKDELLAKWLADRYPLFRKNYDPNLAELERLLEECRESGFTAVLLELPLNLEIVGDELDAPRGTYQKDARALADEYGVPWLSFVDELGIANGSFYDLMHLVEPGRTTWQERMSREVARLLENG